jgi:formylglycine-generating enzyme
MFNAQSMLKRQLTFAIGCVLFVAGAFGSAGPEAQGRALTNSIGMEFVLILPGTMTVGRFQPPYPKPPGKAFSAEEYARIEEAAKADSMPGFKATIARSYYIGKYEVTQAEWKKVMGTNPSIFQGTRVTDEGDRHPVDNVTWDDAQAFVKRLNAMEKTTAYRLPTEFEWEYAARAGADDDIPWAAIREQAIAGYNTYFNTHTVGEKKPNAWGLYDTLGNVWEWVQDYYNEKIFADPTPPRSGTQHVLKGGGFAADVKNATYLTHGAGPGSKFDVGFRVAKAVE